MKNDFNLSISKPCHENFNQFKKTELGGFCNSCEKNVVDFTKMNSDNIIDYFKKNSTKNTCGRFQKSQLHTEAQKPRRSFFGFVSGIGLACLTLFSFGSAKAQNAEKSSDGLEKDASKTQETGFQNTISVKGTITESSIPLPGVNIILEGSNIGTTSNFDGYFEFPQKLKKGDVLVFSFIGMKSQRIIIQDEKSALNVALKIDMTECDVILMGKVAVKEIYSSKKNN